LQQQALKAAPADQTALLQRAFRQRGLYRSLSRLTEKQLRQLDAPALQDLDHVQEMIRHQRELFDLPAYAQRATGQQIVQQLISLADLHYLLLKLPYVIDHLARQNTYNESEEKSVPAELLTAAKAMELQHPLLALYLKLFDGYRDRHCSLPDFTEAVDLWNSLLQKATPNELAFCLIKLCGLGIAEVYKGDLRFLEHLFPLYQMGVERRLFTLYGYFPDDTFLNICTYGAYTNSYEWTSEFIETHRHLLPADVAKNAVVLGRAILAFHQGRFDDVRILLRSGSSKRLTYKVRIRSLLVRCLLELHIQDTSYLPSLLNLIRSHERAYRREQGLSEERRAAYLHLYRMIRAIARLRETAWQQPAAHRRVREKIESFTSIVLKPWLLEKVDIQG
jgi:hypothetical protein